MDAAAADAGHSGGYAIDCGEPHFRATPEITRSAVQTHVEANIGFEALIASRRAWIEAVLKPWLRTASRRDLLFAEQEWIDLAGRADPRKTLWPWAWSRFPVLYVDDLGGLEESFRVQVTLRDGSQHTGYPDARQSLHGELVLLGDSVVDGSRNRGPFSIDDVVSVERA